MVLVRESLEFERGKDPKEALGIGRSTWETLKIGDMMRCTKYVRTAQQWAPGGDFSDPRAVRGTTLYSKPAIWHDGDSFEVGEVYIITSVEPYEYDEKKLEIISTNIKWGNGGNRIVATPRQLANRFNVLSRGEAEQVKKEHPGQYEYWMKTNEGLEFERGKDPKEALGVGLAATVIPTITSNDLEMYSDYYDEDNKNEEEMEAYFKDLRYQDMVDDGEEDQYWEDLKRAKLIHLAIGDKIQFAEFFDHKEFDAMEDYLERGRKGFPFAYNAYPGGDGIFVVWSKINLPAAELVED